MALVIDPDEPYRPAVHERVKMRVQTRTGTTVDRLLLAIMKRQQKSPRRRDFERLATDIRAAHQLFRRNGLLGSPERFHKPPGPLRRPSISRGLYPGLAHEVLRFQSDYQPLAGCQAGRALMALKRNGTVMAYVARHRDKNRPWLVCLHGLGCGERWMDFPGFRVPHLHRQLGLNVICPVLPLHGPRRPRGAGRGELVSKELLQTLHGIAQAVQDVRAVIAWARRQGATRVGVYGLSLGAYVGSLVAGLESLELVIAGIPLVDIPDLFESHMDARTRRMSAQYGITGEYLRELFELISPLSLTPKVPLAERFIFAGSGDSITGPEQARALWRHWEKPRLHWYSDGHVGFFWSKAVPRVVDEMLSRAQFRSQ